MHQSSRPPLSKKPSKSAAAAPPYRTVSSLLAIAGKGNDKHIDIAMREAIQILLGTECVEVEQGGNAIITSSTPREIGGIISKGFGPCQPIAIIACPGDIASLDSNNAFCSLYHISPGMHFEEYLFRQCCALPREHDIVIIHSSEDPKGIISEQIARAYSRLRSFYPKLKIRACEIHDPLVYGFEGGSYILTRNGWLVNEFELDKFSLGTLEINVYQKDSENFDRCKQFSRLVSYRPSLSDLEERRPASTSSTKSVIDYCLHERQFMDNQFFQDAIDTFPPVLTFDGQKYVAAYSDVERPLMTYEPNLATIILRERCRRFFTSPDVELPSDLEYTAAVTMRLQELSSAALRKPDPGSAPVPPTIPETAATSTETSLPTEERGAAPPPSTDRRIVAALAAADSLSVGQHETHEPDLILASLATHETTAPATALPIDDETYPPDFEPVEPEPEDAVPSK